MRMNKTEREYLADKGWTIVAEWNNRCIVSSYNTYHTIFFMQNLGWHLKDIQEDDIWDNAMWRVERNLLYYYK